MRVQVFRENVLALLITSLLCASALAKTGDVPPEPMARLLPDRLAGYRAVDPVWIQPADTQDESSKNVRQEFGVLAIAHRDYLAKDGEELGVSIYECRSESAAYALLTNSGSKANYEIRYGYIGTASWTNRDVIKFMKGSTLVHVSPVGMGIEYPQANTANLARGLAELLDKGSGEIPALAQHLPNWETEKGHTVYAITLKTLRETVPNQSVLDAVSFDGGVEAVTVRYDSSQLVIVEFNTPQLAGDNDVRITAKIQELRNQGQSVPTAYRRVGNYSVFVFNGPDEQTANQLIDQVKYQQVVQWLGNRPDNLAERQREFIETTLGVFVSVVKASGIAIVLCIAVGGFLGALLFSRRRARQATAQAYSDAGGMLRLNIDELSAPTDAGKLIGPGNG
jgi:Family of unknown function (DUF6599)